MTAAVRRLAELLEAAGVRALHPPGGDPPIRGVTLDSRSVVDGDLFFALPGLARHGADFVPQAVSRGARAVLSDRPRPAAIPAEVAWIEAAHPRAAAGRLAREFFGRPDDGMCLIGITGTNGKTTVTYLVESIARAAGRNPGRIGTVGATFTGEQRPLSRTTPEAPDLFRILAEMRDAGVDVVAMEVSSHALALERVAGARFHVAALTGLGRDHLDFHGTLERYFETKAALFERLEPGATAVLPADDPAGQTLTRRTPARVVTFGRSAGSSIRITREVHGPRGSEAVLQTDSGSVEIRTRLVGRFNLDNAAAAAACALAAGIPLRSVPDGIAATSMVPGRLERVDLGQPFQVFVDYAHTPEAIRAVLSTVRELVPGRILIVFGCGGERDRGKRPEMGRAAAEGAEAVFVTSDNPRGEDPASIARDVESGIASVPGGATRLRTILDRRDAVAAAIAEARAGDAVIIAGKGHETAQEIGGMTVDLDDRVLSQQALRTLGYGAGDAHARA